MTTTVEPRRTTADDVVDAVTALLPAVAARAADIERRRRLPADLLADLVAAGCFRLALPPAYGGIGAPLPSALPVTEALATADASTAWTVMIGAHGWVDLAGLPRPVFDALFDAGPDVMIAGVFSPSGAAVPVAGGYRVSGRWGFASGSPHSEWLYGNCVEEHGGGGRLRIALFRRSEVEVEDTWHVVGLCGTGSHHFRVDDVFVPGERTWAVTEEEPTLDAPVVRIPPPTLFALNIAAVAIGVARGALDDVLAAAPTKVPLLAGAPLAANPTFHHDIAAADAALRAARALVHETAEEAWEAALDGQPPTPEQRARFRAAAASAVACAAGVVTTAFRAGGGSAVYLDSPLQRRLRDVHAIAQHFLVRPDTLTTAGAALAGQSIDVPIF